MIGIGVESGHISDWRKPRPVCHRVRPGMFAAAGILGLITVVVGFLVYVTAVQAQRLRGQYNYGGGGHFVGPGAPYPASSTSTRRCRTHTRTLIQHHPCRRLGRRRARWSPAVRPSSPRRSPRCETLAKGSKRSRNKTTATATFFAAILSSTFFAAFKSFYHVRIYYQDYFIVNAN